MTAAKKSKNEAFIGLNYGNWYLVEGGEEGRR